MAKVGGVNSVVPGLLEKNNSSNLSRTYSILSIGLGENISGAFELALTKKPAVVQEFCIVLALFYHRQPPPYGTE